MSNKLRIPIANSNKSSSKTTYKVSLNSDIKNKPFKVEKITNFEDVNFNINDRVIHKEEKLIGTVKFIGDEKISVVWDDGTRERFAKNCLGELEKHLEDTSSPNEVNSKELNVSTRSLSSKKTELKPTDKLDDLYQQAFMDMDDEYDDIIDANPNKFEQQTKKIEKTLEKNTINNIKEKAVNELLTLMKNKKIITSNEEEKNQKEKILKMNDSEFEKFKKSIINNKPIKNIEMTEAEKMLERIKHGGAIIGGFDEPGTNTMSGFSSDLSETSRSLTALASNEKTVIEQPKLNLDGFRDLQGLTKPIQVVAEQQSPRENMVSKIAELDWTTLTKQF